MKAKQKEKLLVIESEKADDFNPKLARISLEEFVNLAKKINMRWRNISSANT